MPRYKKCEICGSRGRTYKVEKEKTVYCNIHAHDNGFCPSCGMFYMGIETEEQFYILKYGVCSNCVETMEDNSMDNNYDYAQDDLNYDAHRERTRQRY